ncbi:MAG: thioesterase family protein [Gammaproteobacteria bacterium]|jgi:uncharacterized protein (TIGR00369 family)|nr:thioesterase family protein [Gammaproteobacteria bacterium]
MTIWKEVPTVESMDKRSVGTMMEAIGIKFTEVGEDFVRGKMPVNEKTKQPIGIMHGGASCVLAETIGSTAANFCVDQKTHYCVGLSISTSHIRSAREGFVIGTAKPLHLGRSTQIWNIDITDEQGKLISSTRLTMAVLERQ